MCVVVAKHVWNILLMLMRKLLDTEIDWSTYMQQIAVFLKGERDYRKIEGSTGPLVYPGAHVWIYKYLYKITDEGRNIQLAQYIFALVYLTTLAVVIQCYRKAKVKDSIMLFLLDVIVNTSCRCRHMFSRFSSCQSDCIAFSC
jgi:hypothetical protein